MVCVRHPCHLLQPSGVDRLASFYCSGFRETETERDGTEQEDLKVEGCGLKMRLRGTWGEL